MDNKQLVDYNKFIRNSVVIDIESIKYKDYVDCNKNTDLWKDIYCRELDIENQRPIKNNLKYNKYLELKAIKENQ